MVIIQEGVSAFHLHVSGVFAYHKERWLVLLWGYTLLAAEYMRTFRFLYLSIYVCLRFSIRVFKILPSGKTIKRYIFLNLKFLVL